MTESRAVRLDKWLWAARFFKTRRLASDAIKGGKVELNGVRAKPAKDVRVGDRLSVHKDAFEFVVEVEGLSEKRGPATEAVKLYTETEDSMRRREELKEQLRAQARAFPRPDHRPGKRDRRDLAAFKRGNE